MLTLSEIFLVLSKCCLCAHFGRVKHRKVFDLRKKEKRKERKNKCEKKKQKKPQKIKEKLKKDRKKKKKRNKEIMKERTNGLF
jgi:hypothetical protein